MNRLLFEMCAKMLIMFCELPFDLFLWNGTAINAYCRFLCGNTVRYSIQCDKLLSSFTVYAKKDITVAMLPEILVCWLKCLMAVSMKIDLFCQYTLLYEKGVMLLSLTQVSVSPMHVYHSNIMHKGIVKSPFWFALILINY